MIFFILHGCFTFLLLIPQSELPNFSGKFLGMLITAALLGFVIGGGIGLIFMSILYSFRSENLPTKKAMMIGGVLGAIVGGIFFSYIAL